MPLTANAGTESKTVSGIDADCAVASAAFCASNSFLACALIAAVVLKLKTNMKVKLL